MLRRRDIELPTHLVVRASISNRAERVQPLPLLRFNDRSPVFFDRSPVCTLALARHLGFAPPDDLLAEISRLRKERVYSATVFFIRNQGHVEPTAARRISFAESLSFERIHEETYRELGFDLVEVPPAPLVERAALVLDTVALLEGA